MFWFPRGAAKTYRQHCNDDANTRKRVRASRVRRRVLPRHETREGVGNAGNASARVTRAVIVCKQRFIYSAPRGIRTPCGQEQLLWHATRPSAPLSVRGTNFGACQRAFYTYSTGTQTSVSSAALRANSVTWATDSPNVCLIFFFFLSIILSFAMTNTGSKGAGRPKTGHLSQTATSPFT